MTLSSPTWKQKYTIKKAYQENVTYIYKKAKWDQISIDLKHTLEEVKEKHHQGAELQSHLRRDQVSQIDPKHYNPVHQNDLLRQEMQRAPPPPYQQNSHHYYHNRISMGRHSDNGQRKEKSNSEISSSPLRHAEIEIKLAQAIDQLTNPESLLNEEQNLKETPTITATPDNEITVPNNQHVDHPSMNLPQHSTEEEKQKQQHFLGKIGQPKEPPDIQELDRRPKYY
ncbi:unnamed protein product [Mytilus edulis]|uniref:Uncharacterized protein n=1 Tax=Mytilus edulis TaxID=6550 RepID=A0A8S3SXR7_MYTED|nr:unnamed protein product [Mytilus edulis]